MSDLFSLLFNIPLFLSIVLLLLAWKQPGKRVIALPVALLIYIVSTPAIANWLSGYVEAVYPASPIDKSGDGHGTLILVLTDGWWRMSESGYEVHVGEAGWERLESALRLHARIGGTLMITGQPAPDGSDSAARYMADVARDRGVPSEELRVEPHATNTYENIVFSKALIPAGTVRVLLVTSALHMPRAMAVARRQGIDATAAPCDFRTSSQVRWLAWIPSHHGLVVMQRMLHEAVGLVVYRLRGWA